MDAQRKQWNEELAQLRTALGQPQTPQRAVELFLRLHAQVHTARIAAPREWSFQDGALADLTGAQVRCIPRGALHSIAWHVWHSARIEDMTMNLLVAGRAQVFGEDDWGAQMHWTMRDSGNAMDAQTMAEFSAVVDFKALLAYRLAVGRRTRAIVKRLDPAEWKQRVDPARLQRVVDEGAVDPRAHGIIEYWGGRTLAGLLLMPATRHHLVHWNQSLRMKNSVRRAV